MARLIEAIRRQSIFKRPVWPKRVDVIADLRRAGSMLAKWCEVAFKSMLVVIVLRDTPELLTHFNDVSGLPEEMLKKILLALVGVGALIYIVKAALYISEDDEPEGEEQA